MYDPEHEDYTDTAHGAAWFAEAMSRVLDGGEEKFSINGFAYRVSFGDVLDAMYECDKCQMLFGKIIKDAFHHYSSEDLDITDIAKSDLRNEARELASAMLLEIQEERRQYDIQQHSFDKASYKA